MNLINRTDKIILSIALLIVALFSYFMFDDSLLFKEVSESDQEMIGNIFQLHNDVRLKSVSAFAWRSAGKKLEVHQKDSIYTGEKSEVSIQLEDGSIINLKENSLVTLNVKNGETTLDLKYGDFIGELKEDSQLKVTAGKEVYDLKGQKSANNEKTILKLNKSRSGQLEIKLQQGAANVKTKKQTRVLEKDQLVALVPKVVETPKPNIRLLVPDRSLLKQLKDGDGLPLSWSASLKVPRFQVEIARDSSFKEMTWQGPSTDEKLMAPMNAGEGEFYWRVKALSNSGVELNASPTNSFRIVRLEAPILLAPEKNQMINLEVKIGAHPEDFKSTFKIKWTATKDAVQFHYQVATDANFEKIIQEKTQATLEALSQSLPSGEYFVKVRAEKDAVRFSRWSETGSVQLSINMEQRPPAPRLVKLKLDFNPATAEKRTPSSEAIPAVAWEKPKNINHFKIQVGRTKNFDEAKIFLVSGDRFEIKDYQPGLTYYRVYSMSARGIASLPSEIGTISVSFLEPKLNPLNDILVNALDKNVPAPVKETPISWSPVPGAKKYLLEISGDSKFKNPKKLEVAAAAVPVLLDKPGTYHVRVAALNEQGKIISRYSPAANFDYIYRVPLNMPWPLEPYDKTTVFMQQDKEAYLWLEWKSVKDIKLYQIEVSTTPKFDKLALKAETKEPRFLVKQKLPTGKLYWRVKAISESAEMSSDWTNALEFSLIFNKNESYQ